MTGARPRFATPRNPDRDTIGPEVVDVMRRLRYDPLPWQIEAADLLGELDDDGSLWYRSGTILTPRQSGKSTFILGRQTHRMLRSEALGWGSRPQGRISAQHAMDARRMLTDEWMPVVELAEMEEVRRFLRSNGREAIEFHNGGRIATAPPTVTGFHGQTLDAVDLDEAFAYVDDRAAQGARPTMLTRKSPQLVVTSTAGTPESTYLWSLVEQGRELVLSGKDSRTAYIEYSAGPEDDPFNPKHWERFMPGLELLIPRAAVEAERDAMSEEMFLRSMANVWVGSSSAIIPAAVWSGLYLERPRRPKDVPVWLAVDVAPGPKNSGRTASIAAVWFPDDGDMAWVEVIESGAGLAWLPEAIARVTRQHGVRSLTMDSGGPITAIAPELKRRSGVPVVELSARDVAAAAQRWHEDALAGLLAHGGQDLLDAAVAGADQRKLNDGWAFKRRTSSADISPLVAVSFALWTAITTRTRGLLLMPVGRS